MIRNDRIKVIMDSGAFSAWTKNTQINLDDYIDFIKRNINKISIAVALDVIPGSPGKHLTTKDRNDAAKQSRINYIKMIKKGIPINKLMPVYHQGEDEKWLKKMVKDCEYIGISPANDKTTKQRGMWLDNVCSSYIMNSKKEATIKFHGFAVTSFKLMKKYPWYSVDSATWKITAGRGTIILPKKTYSGSFDNGFFSFPISNKPKENNKKSFFVESENKREYDLLPKKIKIEINNFIKKNNGDIEKLRNDLKERYAWNIRMIQLIQKEVNVHIFFASVDTASLIGFKKEKAKNVLLTKHFINEKFLNNFIN